MTVAIWAAFGARSILQAVTGDRARSVAAAALGFAQRALDEAISRSKQREQFGQPIARFQQIGAHLADSFAELEAARLLVYRAATNAGRGFPSMYESAMAKCFANEMVRDVAGTAMQLMGGYGYSKQFDMERRLRDAWGWGIAGGTIDVQKTNIAAALVGRRFDQRR